MVRATLSELRGARNARQDQLARLPNVIGSGLGVKRKSGAKVDATALVIFVSRKRSLAEIGRAAQIPKYVIHRKQYIPTDVVEISAIRPEFGSAPFFVNDSASKGVVAAFAYDQDAYCVVTCAHCLNGLDGNPHTDSPIGIWDNALGNYVKAGMSRYAVNSPGLGLPGDFGFVDAGVATLDHPKMIERARISPPLSVRGGSRRGIPVSGVGPRGRIVGEIDAVEVVVEDYRADILVLMSGSGSFPGCSGMMWLSNRGQAIGMHAYGAHFTDGESRYSLSMAAHRIETNLQIELLDPN